MKKKHRNLLSLFCFSLALSVQGQKLTPEQMQSLINSVPESTYEKVRTDKLLTDTLYMKMLEEGWSMEEILRVTDGYVSQNIKELKGSSGFALYAKQLKPMFFGNESMKQQIIPEAISQETKRTQAQIRTQYRNADEYVPRQFYDPASRFTKRDPGLFKHMNIQPAGGRVEWIVPHPDDPDKIMAKPDGDGIWRTDDGGRTWDCVTDRIPNRFHRNEVEAHAIPVDPDDWNHFYAFPTNGNPVYQTTDGGQSWRQIPGATHKGFKRGHAFRDARGKLKFIGANPNSAWNSKLWISEDTCKTWRQITMPADQMDVHPESGSLGFWFQEFAFHPTNRDMLFVPTSRSILQSTDGGETFRKMQFKVYNADSTELRSDTTVFPLRATSPMFIEIDPHNPKRMWAALGIRNVNKTALYRSNDGGETWLTIHEPLEGVGSGTIFGNEAPWGWLGGFGLNFMDQNFIYGCSMSSAWSENGGENFREFAWGVRMKGFYEDGSLAHVACARHNADNHCIRSHKSGRVYRGSDAGILVKDKNINNHEWTNVTGNMGNMLFYHIGVSEFGPQMVMGNTQDVDAQIYRRGRWGHWHGYEGSTAFTNPYSGEEYHSGGRSGRVWPTNQTTSSWSTGYSKPNVCTGNWFLQRGQQNPDGSGFGIIKDFGRTTQKIDPVNGSFVIDFALARNKPNGTLFVITKNYEWYKSEDEGVTFTQLIRPTINGKACSFNRITVNPDNDQEIYLAGKNLLYKTVDGGLTWQDITYDLPKNMDVNNFVYHEGSGDIYLMSHANGIFLLEHGTTNWQFWSRGVNVPGYKYAMISYPTQEMVWADYGRGVWVADLQNPSDRFFKNNFALKEMSHVDGRRTIGIDTHWTVPEVYTYKWYVNGELVPDQTSRYFYGDNLKNGDQVQLRITMFESPDVSTLSAVHTVAASEPLAADYQPGNAISSNGKGRMDLGYVDLFRDEFTIDFWLNPRSNGVVLANRQVEYAGAKGFNIRVSNNNLYFNYAPDHIFAQPNNETGIKQDDGVNAGKIEMNQWSHVAITHKQDDVIQIYINGKLCATADRILPMYDLNNAVYLSLFADGYEMHPIDASVDQLRIYGKRMNASEIRKQMYGQDAAPDKLLFFHNFNEDVTASQKELFTRSGIAPRIMGEVKFEPFIVPLGLDKTDSKAINTTPEMFVHGNDTIAEAKINAASPKSVLIGKYNSDNLAYAGNLSKAYYQIKEGVFYFECFDDFADSDSVTIHIPQAKGIESGLIFVSERDCQDPYWSEMTSYQTDSSKGTYTFTLPLTQINRKLFVIARQKPAMKLSVENMSGSKWKVYGTEQLSIPVKAELVEGLVEPVKEYVLKTDMEGVSFADPLYFVEGKANTILNIPQSWQDNYGGVHKMIISGQDERLVPFQLNMENRILPAVNKSHLVTKGGGAMVGDADRFSRINQSNTLSMSTWVRVDTTWMFSDTRPLLLFRGGGKTLGFQLRLGELRSHWNEESWSWNTGTGLRVTEDMIGEWVHIALTADPDGLTYYLNGQSFRINRKLNPTGVHSCLYIGKNDNSDNKFRGAFDQVTVWSRTLSHDEVIGLMHAAPKADKDLLCYVSFDRTDSEGTILEMMEDTPVRFAGTTEVINQSLIPFGNRNQVVVYNPLEGNVHKAFDLRMPDAYTSPYFVTRIADMPVMLHTEANAAYRPLEGAYYIAGFDKSVPAGVNATVHVNNAAIQEGDSLLLLTRALGSSERFMIADTVVAGTGNTVQLTWDAPGAAQAMVFIRSAHSGGQAKLQLTSSVSDIILDSETTEIPFVVTYLSGDVNEGILLSVTEPYARLEKDSCKFDNGFESHNKVILDKQAMDKFASSTITIQAMGAEAEPLVIRAEFEPVVNIRLKNDDGTNKLITENSKLDIEVETELLQGVLKEPVRFSTTSDVANGIMTSLGQLLSENSFSDYNLVYHDRTGNPTDRGFNLIGNPYMTDINLTKSDNVSFSDLNRYIYTYNPYEMCYYPFDMMQYDETNRIQSMGAFFVQTISNDAMVQIHNKAKQQVLNKRNTTHIMLQPVDEIQLKFYVDGKASDRVAVRLEDGALNSAELGEDAMKLFSFEQEANQFYTFADGEYLSIDCREKGVNGETQLGARLTNGNKLEMEVSGLKATSGFKGFVLRNRKDGSETLLSENKKVLLDKTALQGNQYSIAYRYEVVSEDKVNDKSACYVSVDNKTVRIHNLSGDAKVAIYSLNGQMILNAEVKEPVYTTRLNSGVYIVRVMDNGQEFSSKFIVK